MKLKYIIKGIIATILLTIAITSCDNYNEELLDGLGNSREFSPIELKATIRNRTSVELNWTARENVDHYVVEFSADDTAFTTITKTLEVTSDQLPLLVPLEGEILYSIRVKAVTSGIADSKWSVTTANTLSEQLFLPVIDGDIRATEATLRWIPNSPVTEIIITPGAIKHTITPAEKTNGVAIITGLTGETIYTADLMDGIKRRGSQIFTTGLDIGNGILVTPNDDLFEKIAIAEDGAVLVLEPGDYTKQVDQVIGSKSIALYKSITIRGLRSYNKPKLNHSFSIKSGAVNVSLIDLDLNGTGLADAYFMTIADANTTYGDISISGCNVYNFDKALIYGSVSMSKLKSFSVDNSVITKVNTTASADFVDFRTTYVENITLKNSTFDSCSTGRDFVRADAAAGLTGTGLTTNVLIESCTLYKVSNTSAPKRILYVRFASNTSTVRNTLITDTSAIYTNQAATTVPIYTKNYYFNAPSFMDSTIANNKPDASGTVADPQFTDAATGNFTLQNQTLIDNKIGDPRWIK